MFKLTLLLVGALAVNAQEFVASSIKAPFVEQFDGAWEKRWTVSQAKKTVDGVTDENLLRYRGEFKVEEASVWPGIPGDKGLVLKTDSAHHFDKPINPKGKTLVVQYEVKFQKDHECGGAYVKLLTANDSFDPTKFEDKTPYTIMFGPDKCGFNNKVHFIFRHKNSKSGVVEEKHLIAPPEGKFTKKTGLYTLIVKPDNTFKVLINEEEVKSGSLLKDFEPSVNPPKEIDDPEDTKPEDWVDEAKIPDPKATKPEDWDEDAPAEIPDEKAEKPADWLEDEPLTVPDPSATKPEDWDDEEDGDWTPQDVPNPKCEKVSGCGPWTRPNIPNPAYKGKWTAPLIDNPAYKGEWKPRKIANPNYVEDKHPADFTPIGALGLELWTINSDIMFDNFFIGHSEADAKKFAEETWRVKVKGESLHELEAKKKEDAQKAEEAKKADDAAAAKGDEDFVAKAKRYANILQRDFALFAEKVQKDPKEAVSEFPHVLAAIFSVVSVLLLPLVIFGGSKPAPVKKASKKTEGSPKKSDASPKKSEGSPKKEKEEKAEESAKTRARKTKKEDDE